MGIYSIKPAFRKLLKPVEQLMVHRGISADALTITGLAFAGVAGFGLWAGRAGNGWLLLVPLGAFLRMAANALDGMVATSTGTARPAGEVLNEVTDRIGDVAVFLPLTLVPGVSDALVAASLSAMLVASYVGIAIKAAGGPRVYSGIMGKPDRMFVVGAAALIAVPMDDPGTVFDWALAIILAGAVVTILMRAVAGSKMLAQP
jgi:CDP-diacylglycerol--glycerol-3-phosphate 3-phosphatidyltransferase